MYPPIEGNWCFQLWGLRALRDQGARGAQRPMGTQGAGPERGTEGGEGAWPTPERLCNLVSESSA